MFPIYAEITKVDDEQRMVFGYASTETRDQQGEVVRRGAIEGALPDYLKFSNIREMHQPSAVGVAKEADMDDKGLWLGAHVVDDAAWRKVKAGVYKGFSVGGRVTKRDPMDRSIITGLELTEISLVDRPANPDAVYTMVKRVNGELVLQPAQVWDCGVPGHQHSAKEEAAKCMAQSAGRIAKAALVLPPITVDAEGAINIPSETMDVILRDIAAKGGNKPGDGSKPYGDVPYADPGYQEDKKKRYPLDTEQHIRAAWNYINKPKNAGKYSSDEVSHIKSKIIAAWKSKIDSEGPPSADSKKAVETDMEVLKLVALWEIEDIMGKRQPRRDGGQFATHAEAAKAAREKQDFHESHAKKAETNAKRHQSIADKALKDGDTITHVIHDRLAQHSKAAADEHTQLASHYQNLAAQHESKRKEAGQMSVADVTSAAAAAVAKLAAAANGDDDVTKRHIDHAAEAKKAADAAAEHDKIASDHEEAAKAASDPAEKAAHDTTAHAHRDLADGYHELHAHHMAQAATQEGVNHEAAAKVAKEAAGAHAAHAEHSEIHAAFHDGEAAKAVSAGNGALAAHHKSMAAGLRKSAERRKAVAKAMGDLHNLHNEAAQKVATGQTVKIVNMPTGPTVVVEKPMAVAGQTLTSGGEAGTGGHGSGKNKEITNDGSNATLTSGSVAGQTTTSGGAGATGGAGSGKNKEITSKLKGIDFAAHKTVETLAKAVGVTADELVDALYDNEAAADLVEPLKKASFLDNLATLKAAKAKKAQEDDEAEKRKAKEKEAAEKAAAEKAAKGHKCAACGKAVDGEPDKCPHCGEKMDKAAVAGTVADQAAAAREKAKKRHEAKKAAFGGSINKGMYTVARLADLCAQMESLCESVEIEQITEGDEESQLPQKLHTAVQGVIEILRDMVTEETAELLEGEDEDVAVVDHTAIALAAASRAVEWPTNMARAYRHRASKATALPEKKHWRGLAERFEKLAVKMQSEANQNAQKLHDALAQKGAVCPTAKQAGEATAKTQSVEGERDQAIQALKKFTEQLEPMARDITATHKRVKVLEAENTDLKKRLGVVESMPGPDRSRPSQARTISRSADTGAGGTPSGFLDEVLAAPPGAERQRLILSKAYLPTEGRR